MRALAYKIVRDRSILKKITAHYPILTCLHNVIKTAYKEYILKKGSPTIIPITVTEPQRKQFESAYSIRPAAAGLDWIEQLYINGLSSCPFCGGDGARTIEHFLPQASYPEFAVYSLNLMPSCGSCNSKRGDKNAYGAPLKLLHPFFDGPLLKKLDVYTRVRFRSGIPDFTLIYDRAPFNDDEQDRIDNHLTISVDETSYINRTLSSLETLKISAEAYDDLHLFRTKALDEQIYISVRKNDLNSWHHALCKGLQRLPDSELNEIFSKCFGRRTV